MGRSYLCDMQLSGVREGELGVIPPPPLRKYNYLTEVVVFCNKKREYQLRGQQGEDLDRGGGPLLDLHDQPNGVWQLGGAQVASAAVLALPLQLVHQETAG